ncbi:MAG: methylmalonyl Co-A mutase-associated GTPase MeaB [Deltaproteobacteria bacterium]|nr:MAG: methylmalonyl Co-A mutase-associated GTPase MeaB [Deltaproteobacteria bacterium]
MNKLVTEVLQGSVRAMARLITLVENEDPCSLEYLGAIYPHTGNAHVLGITGSPGTGKSTLTDRITTALRRRAQSVGIIAVDPSSPFTGGALLGDRIRMQRASGDSEVFIRSMATRGNLGGLARTTADVVKIMDAFGKDWIIVETVGVGQDEVDIVRTADTTIVVLAPGLGDTIQSMKAGVMEIADLYAVNKADRSGAEALLTEVKLRVEQDAEIKKTLWQAPVLKTVALDDQGTESLLDAVVSHRNFLKQSGNFEIVRREKAREETLSLLKEEISRTMVEKILGNGRFEALIDDIVAFRKDPYTSVQEIVGTIFPDSE